MNEDTALTPAPEPPTQIAITENGLAPSNHTELYRLAERIAGSQLVPKGLQGKAADCFIVMANGLELGFSAMQALQSFHVVNGKLGLPYQTVIALINASGLCEDLEIGVEGEGDERRGYVRSKRIGRTRDYPKITFTLAQARKAKLFPASSPDKPWNRYTDDMLIAKAVARSGNRDWADVLKGHKVYEDLRDIEPERQTVDITPAPVVIPATEGSADPARALLAGASQPDESPDSQSATWRESSADSERNTPSGGESHQGDLENPTATEPPKSASEPEPDPEPKPKPRARKASERAAARAEAAAAARSSEPAPEPDPLPEPEVVEPEPAEPDQEVILCDAADKAEIWRRAQQRAGKHAEQGMIQTDQVSECALEIMALALKAKGYEWVKGEAVEIQKEDRRSILARIDNAKVPEQFITA